MKKFLKRTAILLLAILMTVVAFVVLVYLPPFQNWAVRRVAAYASRQTGMDIRIERVGIAFPLDLSITGLHVEKPNDSIPNLNDTIADARHLTVDVRLLPLLESRVEIDALHFSEVKVNTDGLIKSARIVGSLESLNLESHGIDLTGKTVRVDSALISGADIDIQLADTVPEDTTAADNLWKVNIDRLHLSKTRLALHMPGDTLSVRLAFDNASAAGTSMDFHRSRYHIDHLRWRGGGIAFDNNFEPRSPGLDFSHLQLSELVLDADSFDFCDPKIDVRISRSSFREKSGLDVRSLTSRLGLDAGKIYLTGTNLVTSESEMDVHFVMDRNTFSYTAPGKMHLTANGFLGKQDLMLFLADLPEPLRRKWPARPLKINTVLSGNMRRVVVAGLVADLPTAFHLNARGTIDNLADPARLRAALTATAQTHDLSFATAALPPGTLDGITIPRGIGITGRFNIDGQRYRASFRATEAGGTLAGTADVNTAGNLTYTANLTASNLNIGHFMPRQGPGAFSGKVDVKGAGTDIRSPRTGIDADVAVTKFAYAGYDLSGMGAKVTLGNGHAIADINSNNPLIKGNIRLDALLAGKQISATIGADIAHIDFHRLKLASSPLTASFCTHLDVTSDLDQSHTLRGTVADLMLREGESGFFPDDISLDLIMRPDTTHFSATNGDFNINFDAAGGHKVLIKRLDALMAQAKADFDAKIINRNALREKLPTASLNLNSGSDNFLSHMLRRFGYSFGSAKMNLVSSPQSGLNGDMEIQRLLADSMLLDTVRLKLHSDTGGFFFNGQVRNNRRNPQYVFNALFDGRLVERGLAINLRYFDQRDSLGVSLGAVAEMEQGGIRMRMFTDNPVIGYKHFSINQDNYIFMGNDRRLSARLRMSSDDGVDVQLYSDDDNTDALQDLTLSISRLKIEDIVAVVPYMPRMSGTVNGDYHFIQTPSDISVGSIMSVTGMTYEGSSIGNLGTEFVYMPKDDGSHYVDGIVYSDEKQVATVIGTYRSEGNGYLDATMTMEKMPMSVLNGMIPDRLIAFEGEADGNLSLRGTLTRPQVDGSLTLNNAWLVSEPYGMRMQFDSTPLNVVGSKVGFHDFNLRAANNTPLVVNGEVDFSNLDDITMNIRMAAQNFQLVNAKETRRSEAFGKAYVDLIASLQGSLNDLTMRGRMDVLGTTDLSYVLRDSPLSSDYRMDELVRFTDFADTTQTAVNHTPAMGFNMDFTINVDRAARVVCYLNTDHSNFVDLMGDGSLRLRYSPSEDFRIRGRYTLNNGEMKYSMPVIPLKTFTITDGSYIEFTGDPMNPRLNITATERTKSSVSINGESRSVDFECGVVISKTLRDMGLQFVISAPEDMAVQNDLNMMSEEEQGKLAVAMLTTGMYIADGNTSALNMNNALSSFLQSGINNIAGNALRTLDFSIGFDNAFDASGAMHTDYSFRFAKRFWNNRLRVVVGGKISTSSDMTDRDQAFFDNVTLEYRMSQTSNKYLKMFYRHGAYDWLEGENSEYGVGFIWRRKVNHFSELFRRETATDQLDLSRLRKTGTPDNASRDSLNNKVYEDNQKQ
ncbi:MAG: translocation/assembly module TamB domain-containing protein [Prevotella sp.]|uniref:translocation/assembly module TamB domain-containing protein n=1 Tax=Prevotella sp. TaxID=59823 RepID=UPI002A34407D|nr:translocation/assembly module TamB domain-containing protein [Prevotella sp.]MDD7319317.1 translocation/assembly module TamB domain-containing protein [Prevotellaceae bacterium]MDY4020853.1 translocation/assembly module TamB domain-containing protein [Prevotella sp.]